MKLLISLVIFASVVYVECRRKNQHSCTDFRPRLDKWSQDMFVVGDYSTHFPKSQQELRDDHCKRVNRGSNHVRQEVPCLKLFPRQVLNAMLQGNRKTMKRICKSNESRQEFVDNTACLAEPKIEHTLHTCVHQYVDYLEQVRDNYHDLNLKVPHTCCRYWVIRKCVIDEFERYCSKKAIEYGNKFLDDLFKDVLDLVCNKWERDSEKCRDLALVPVPDNYNHTSISFTLPLMDIFTQVATEDDRR